MATSAARQRVVRQESAGGSLEAARTLGYSSQRRVPADYSRQAQYSEDDDNVVEPRERPPRRRVKWESDGVDHRRRAARVQPREETCLSDDDLYVRHRPAPQDIDDVRDTVQRLPNTLDTLTKEMRSIHEQIGKFKTKMEKEESSQERAPARGATKAGVKGATKAQKIAGPLGAARRVHDGINKCVWNPFLWIILVGAFCYNLHSRWSLMNSVVKKVTVVTPFRVIDGDTVDVTVGAKRDPLRMKLLGVEAPERGQAYHVESLRCLNSIILGMNITAYTYFVDEGTGMFFADMWVSPMFRQGEHLLLQMLLLQKGCVWHNEMQDGREQLTVWMEEAKANKTGLWAGENLVSPWAYRNNLKAQQRLEERERDSRKRKWKGRV